MVLWSGILVCTEFKCIVKFLFDILLYCGLRRHPVGWVDSRFLSWLWRRSVTRLHCVFCVVSSTNCISISHYMVWALLNKEFDRIWNEGLWQHFRKGAEQNHPPPRQRFTACPHDSSGWYSTVSDSVPDNKLLLGQDSLRYSTVSASNHRSTILHAHVNFPWAGSTVSEPQLLSLGLYVWVDTYSRLL